MATLTTPASAPPSSPACWRRRAIAWPFWLSRTGTRRRRSAPWASPGTAYSSAAAIWTPWWRTTRWPSAAAHGICTVPAARWVIALTGPPSSTPIGRGRRFPIRPSSSAGWRRLCAASPTMTTGRIRCAAVSCSMPRRPAGLRHGRERHGGDRPAPCQKDAGAGDHRRGRHGLYRRRRKRLPLS